MKKLAIFLATCILVSFLPVPARAEAGGSAASGGYLVKLREGAAVPETLADSFTPVDGDIWLASDEAAADELLSRGLAEYKEPDQSIELFDTAADNTPSTVSNGWAYDAMHTDAAAAAGLNGSGVKIAVIDSGFKKTADFDDASVEAGYNFLDDSSDVTDNIGHGTVVAAMIAGDADDVGVKGIAPKATIVPFKCFDTNRETTVSTVIPAIDRAVADGCSVINMSWGFRSLTDETSKTLLDALQAAADNGVILVAAAGNIGSGNTADTLMWPAAYDCVVGVGSVDNTLTVSSFSQQTTAVAACAPGTDVYTDTKTHSGTSFAAPCVAAAAALLMQKDTGLTQSAFQTLLRGNAVDLGGEGWDKAYGYGFVRIDALLQKPWTYSKLTATDALFCGRLETAAPETLVAAAYGGGRMCAVESTSIASAGNYSFHFDVSAERTLFRLFTLNADTSPAADVLQLGTA